MPAWDMAIYILDSRGKTFDFVKMAEEVDRVFCGQRVYSIGNPDGMFRTFMDGLVSYPFDGYNRNNLPHALDMPTKDFAVEASLDDKIQPHRTSGSISEGGAYFESLDANIPIIPLTGLSGAPGASGSPIFNKRGCVVGMINSGANQLSMAIHFYALNTFIKLVFEKIDQQQGKKRKSVH